MLVCTFEPVLFLAGLQQEHILILHNYCLDILNLDLAFHLLQSFIAVVSESSIEDKEVLLLPAAQNACGFLHQVPFGFLGLFQHLVGAHFASCFLVHL